MGKKPNPNGKYEFKDECEIQKYLVSEPIDGLYSIDVIDENCLKDISNNFSIHYEKVYHKIKEQYGEDIVYQRFIASKAYTRYLDSLTIFRSHHAPKSARPSIFKVSGRITYWLMKKPVLASSDPLNNSIAGVNEVFALSVGIGMINQFLKKEHQCKILINKGFRKRILHEFTDHTEVSETALALLFESLATNSVVKDEPR